MLLLFLSSPRRLRVGSLGRITLKRGIYLYVGSGGRSPWKRLRRHLARNKNKFWHIDFLSTEADVLGAFIFESGLKLECVIASSLGTVLPSIKDFGSSDCKCYSHLFFFET